jgi:hypothetical protein
VSGAGASAAVAGQEAALVLRACDSFGSDVGRGGDLVIASLVPVSGPASGMAAASVRDSCDGLYHIAYTALRAVPHELRIRLNGADVNGSPFVVSVGAGPVEPVNCHATVPPARRSVAGSAVLVGITAADAFGNRVTGAAGVQVASRLRGPHEADAVVVDHRSGLFDGASERWLLVCADRL